MSLPLISVLTPTFNRGGTFLSDTILRIQNQYEDGFTHEHIIVDNASTDNTEEVVRGFMKDDPRIKYVRNEKNLWASGGLNVAFKHSQGELIVPFDDDDIMPPLSLQVRFDAMKNSNIKWTSGHALYIDEHGMVTGLKSKNMGYLSNARPFLDDKNELKDPQGFFLSFFRKWMVCGGTVTIRRECIEEVGGWNPDFTVMQDIDMWMKLASKHYHYKLLNDYLFLYRVYPTNTSHSYRGSPLYTEMSDRLRATYQITEKLLAEKLV